MKIDEYMSVRFQTNNGCILCGKEGLWRVKVLDRRNLQHFICLDCLSGLRELEVKNDKNSKEKDAGTKGTGNKEPDTGTTESEGKKQPAGKKPSVDVEGKPTVGEDV